MRERVFLIDSNVRPEDIEAAAAAAGVSLATLQQPEAQAIRWRSSSTSGGPGFWKYETGGKLRPVVERYLGGAVLEPLEIAILRAYLVQWFASPAWFDTAEIEELRRRSKGLNTLDDIDELVSLAVAGGFDPL
jgi:hypothetical protein